MLVCPFCKTPIDEHEAGRCLDAWVQQDVFGYEVKPYPDNWFGARNKDDKNWRGIPPYSTDMGAAWAIVDKLKSEEMPDHKIASTIEVNYNLFRSRGDDDHFKCSVLADGWVHAKAPTAPLAICRAGIKVKEGGE